MCLSSAGISDFKVRGKNRMETGWMPASSANRSCVMPICFLQHLIFLRWSLLSSVYRDGYIIPCMKKLFYWHFRDCKCSYTEHSLFQWEGLNNQGTFFQMGHVSMEIRLQGSRAAMSNSLADDRAVWIRCTEEQMALPTAAASGSVSGYPVLFVTLKDVEDLAFADAYSQLEYVIASLCIEHDYLKDSDKISAADRTVFLELQNRTASKSVVRNSLFMLTRMM